MTSPIPASGPSGLFRIPCLIDGFLLGSSEALPNDCNRRELSKGMMIADAQLATKHLQLKLLLVPL